MPRMGCCCHPLTPHPPLIVISGGGGRQGWCRLVTAAYNYFHVTNFFWMFGEGCYLHTAIVLTYSTDRLRKWMFICIGWGEPAPRPAPTHPAALTRHSHRLQGQGRAAECASGSLCQTWGWGGGTILKEACWVSGSQLYPGDPCPPLGLGLHWGPPGPAPRPH